MSNLQKWTGILATLVIVIILPLYASLEPSQQEQLLNDYYTDAVLASTEQYAQNCAVCHGAAGEGIGDNPPLDSDAVRMMSEVDLYRVIARGRDSTLMAAWAAEEGGIFSNPQVDDFVTFIQQANWEFVEARVTDLGLTPPEVIEMEVSEEMLANLADLPGGEELSAGLLVYAESCAACHGANGAGTVIAPAIDSADLRATPKEETIQLVNSGVHGTLMAAWQNLLPPEQISSVVDLIYRWPEMVQAGFDFPEVEVMSIPSSPELIAAGDRLFNIACKSCHGADGYGTRMAPALNNQIFLAETPDAAIYQIIAGGIPGTLMPGWGSRLNDQDLQSLVAFLRSQEASAPSILPPILDQ
ncbi:MAG: c-type cytochrome [Anaerolineales bacterium]|nr:c-type cytochrome [Anaerolineales bacterium]